MKPAFVPGDPVLLTLHQDVGKSWQVNALVISVQPSDQIPDAKERGLTDSQPWKYWVMTYGDTPYGIRFLGPYHGWELLHAYA
jgi:hypothetical protein